jgi:hypothetical protein
MSPNANSTTINTATASAFIDATLVVLLGHRSGPNLASQNNAASGDGLLMGEPAISCPFLLPPGDFTLNSRRQ